MAYEQTLFSPNNQNFLSPVGFKFIIGRTPNVDFFCQSASIPQVEIGVRDIQTPVKDYSLPGDKMTFGDLNLRFLVNEDLDNYYEIYRWLKGLTNPKHQKNFQGLALTIAGWMKYVTGIDLGGETIDVRDPLTNDFAMIAKKSKTSEQYVDTILDQSKVFPANLRDSSAFRTEVQKSYKFMETYGSLSSIKNLMSNLEN